MLDAVSRERTCPARSEWKSLCWNDLIDSVTGMTGLDMFGYGTERRDIDYKPEGSRGGYAA